MSAADGVRRARALFDRLPVARAAALGGVGLTLGAFLSVLHGVLVVTGDPTRLYYVVAGAALAGTVLARVIRPRVAAAVGIVGVGVGMYLYVASLPGGFGFLALLTPMLEDAAALLSGLSVLRVVNADVWALAAAPAPVFLAWYLAVRGRYGAGAGVAGAGLGLVVLTGDATTATTLAGVVGAVLAVAFGDCDRRGERLRDADGVVVVLAAMVVLTLFVGVVPGAAGSLVSTDGVSVGGETSTVESSLVYAGDSVAVAGAVELSPAVRYTVESESAAYWRVGTYDRYTGGGWVRSGSPRSYRGDLRSPPGRSRTLTQTYTAETSIATLPAAARPTAIRDVPVPVQVTTAGAFQPASPLQAGESYTVVSERPTAGADALREAGTDYPEAVEARYTQLPASTPDRVAERTDRLTANADNPYDTARVVERYLQNDYDYSLDVERPSGDVADRFLFEMDAGYCTYFATTMVTMLRTQDRPDADRPPRTNRTAAARRRPRVGQRGRRHRRLERLRTRPRDARAAADRHGRPDDGPVPEREPTARRRPGRRDGRRRPRALAVGAAAEPGAGRRRARRPGGAGRRRPTDRRRPPALPRTVAPTAAGRLPRSDRRRGVPPGRPPRGAGRPRARPRRNRPNVPRRQRPTSQTRRRALRAGAVRSRRRRGRRRRGRRTSVRPARGALSAASGG
ncbi:hypothetical protein BRD05_07565, partial [Halobacteriales archaeon QS_9_70_65]